MRIHFETLGCKLNQIESESAANSFFCEGFSVSSKPLTREAGEQKDVLLCIINTCTVTGKAEQKARRLINLILDICPLCPVLVTGCYAELDADLIQSIHERIIVLPGTQKGQLTNIAPLVRGYAAEAGLFQGEKFDKEKSAALTEHLRKKIKEISIKDGQQQTAFNLSTDNFFQHSRSSIKIQDGCNNFCTYCRIRLARGKSVSLDTKVIIERVRQLEAAGHREVIITGVNLSQYISSYENRTINIADLLSVLINKTEHISFRISSLYPERVDDELCAILKNERIRPHFHLSVQSGSDRILKLMKRPYHAHQVAEAVGRLRAVKEDAFIACDIISGFPGETEEDFFETQKMCRDLNFTWIHAFPFSARPGTEAFTMKPTVGAQTASKRVLLLTGMAKEQKEAFVQTMMGKNYKAIVEKRQTLPLRAVTENFIHTELIIPETFDPESIKGKEVMVKITEKSTLSNCEAKAIYIELI
jgi:threonylcarbamoyladenosine tRNA methylthiotransferase MtaB